MKISAIALAIYYLIGFILGLVEYLCKGTPPTFLYPFYNIIFDKQISISFTGVLYNLISIIFLTYLKKDSVRYILIALMILCTIPKCVRLDFLHSSQSVLYCVEFFILIVDILIMSILILRFKNTNLAYFCILVFLITLIEIIYKIYLLCNEVTMISFIWIEYSALINLVCFSILVFMTKKDFLSAIYKDNSLT